MTTIDRRTVLRAAPVTAGGAGSTFSPDGRTLYVNIQASNGMTVAIWGPGSR